MNLLDERIKNLGPIIIFAPNSIRKVYSAFNWRGSYGKKRITALSFEDLLETIEKEIKGKN